MTSSARTNLLRELLHTNFPAAFGGKGEPKKPLAVGIGREITSHMPEIAATHLGAALADYTRGPSYLEHVVEGAPRIGLDGKPQGIVTKVEADYAAKRLEGMAYFARVTAERRHAAQGNGETFPCASIP